MDAIAPRRRRSILPVVGCFLLVGVAGVGVMVALVGKTAVHYRRTLGAPALVVEQHMTLARDGKLEESQQLISSTLTRRQFELYVAARPEIYRAREIDVTGVLIDGDRATVRVTADGPQGRHEITFGLRQPDWPMGGDWGRSPATHRTR